MAWNWVVHISICFMLIIYWGRSIGTVKKNTEALVVASKEIGLEVNADKTKYMVMSWDQNVGRSYNIKTDNSSIERVEEFKYLGTTLLNQNSVQEEMKRGLKLGNACDYSVHNLCHPVSYLKV